MTPKSKMLRKGTKEEKKPKSAIVGTTRHISYDSFIKSVNSRKEKDARGEY